MIGGLSVVLVDVLAIELASHFELPAGSLEFHQFSETDLLLVLPDEATVVRMFNGGRPFQLPPVTLHFRRWSWFMKATGITLPTLIEIELKGIPTHAWELETAEHLLDEWCWVRKLHQDTLQRKDYSSFKLMAWCLRPELVPTAMDLVIVEPLVLVEEDPPVKRGLEYPIDIIVSTNRDTHDEDLPPPAPSDDGHDAKRRRRRRRSRSLDNHPRSPARVHSGGAPSTLVHARLGPRLAVAHRMMGEAQQREEKSSSMSSDAKASVVVSPLAFPLEAAQRFDDTVISPCFGNMGADLGRTTDSIPANLNFASRPHPVLQSGPCPAHKASSPEHTSEPILEAFPLNEPVMAILLPSSCIQRGVSHCCRPPLTSTGETLLLAVDGSGLPQAGIEKEGFLPVVEGARFPMAVISDGDGLPAVDGIRLPLADSKKDDPLPAMEGASLPLAYIEDEATGSGRHEPPAGGPNK